MSDYRIVCLTNGHPTEHRHIVSIGTGTNPAEASEHKTVGQVREAISQGDRFYTFGRGETAIIETYRCSCGYQTIRVRPGQGFVRVPECAHGSVVA
jgi:hypothetical protein